MSADQFDAERLRSYIEDRIKLLGLTNDKIAAAGGPSTTKMSQLRKASPTPPRGDVYDKLDRGLYWKPGSARRVALFGGEPSPLPVGLDLAEALAEVDASNLSDTVRRKVLEAWGLDPDTPRQRGSA